MKDENKFLFKKINYILMAVGVALILIGFLLMSGTSSGPDSFDPKEVYSFRRITLAPILIILGFAVEFIAIFKR